MTQIPVLVVDDDSSGLYIKARALRVAGFDVHEAASAAQTIDLLGRRQIQVAVLDVKLPDMHGFELCRLVKTRFPNIVVLQTSATFTSAADRVAGLDIGADAYLVEPMEETELVATVRALMRVRQAEVALRDAEMRFAQFAHASPDILWTYDAGARRFEFVSSAAEKLLGHPPEDLKRDPELWFARIHPEDRSVVGAIIEAGDTHRELPAIEYRFVDPDGIVKWVRDKPFVLPTEGGGRRIGGLIRDVTDNKLAERQRELLVAELNHRVKNTLAIVQAIAAHTLHASSPRDFETAFISRLETLAKAHDLLTRSHWNGASLKDVVDTSLAPFHGPEAKDRIATSGPNIWIAPNTAVTLALAFHELATNATKYGSLSNEAGLVQITWRVEPEIEPREVQLRWRECGGPPLTAPTRKGFGSLLMERVLAYDAQGRTKLSFPASGFEFDLQLPLSDKVKLM
jgi:PAS domain S-box-containing protein